MGFPRYKEWMGERNRLSDVYVRGVREFTKFVRKTSPCDLISCPCVQCRNGKLQPSEEMELHLIKWGMQENYTFWCFHGERQTPFVPEQLPITKNMQLEEKLSKYARLSDPIDDACSVVRGLKENQPLDCKDDQDNSDSDASTQVLGKGKKRGRTCDVGSTVPRTKLEAKHPPIQKLQQVNSKPEQKKAKVGTSEPTFLEKLEDMQKKLDRVIAILNSCPFKGANRSLPVQVPSQFSRPTQSAATRADKGYYHIRDIGNVKNIAMGKIEEMGSGKVVHNRPMKAGYETIVSVTCVYLGMENEPVYLCNQGSGDTIGACVGSSLVWPICLLKKIDATEIFP
ncbi:hypothetical protein LguiB_002678 [Lonicera macranthoides]